MGYYTVATPCVVGKLHYATVPAQPIEVDDSVAAPLVKSGALQPYSPEVQRVRDQITSGQIKTYSTSSKSQFEQLKAAIASNPAIWPAPEPIEPEVKAAPTSRRRRKGDPAP